MISAFFEGGAGTGKTHALVEATKAVLSEQATTSEQEVLVLTYMNGARLRLALRFAQEPQLRHRVSCLTFDAFAAGIVRRRRSLLRELQVDGRASLNRFDAVCADAVQLIGQPAVASWIRAAYPVVVVDEAQDLDHQRFALLKALSQSGSVLVAADEFQNLRREIDPGQQ